MRSFVVSPRTAGDETALALLRMLSAGEASAASTVDALFDLSADPDADGEILADAVHIAAEETTGGDLEAAGEALLRLRIATDGEVVQTSGATNLPVEEVAFRERSAIFTTAVKVPA